MDTWVPQASKKTLNMTGQDPVSVPVPVVLFSLAEISTQEWPNQK